MKEDLTFKQDEMSKSEATASGLAGGEHDVRDEIISNTDKFHLLRMLSMTQITIVALCEV